VLDEPCDGLDPHATWRFLGLLRRIAAEGTALILVTHRVEDIVPEVTRVVMLKDAHVFRDGSKEALLTDEALGVLFDVPARVETRQGWYRLWYGEA
jgi:iron complex transport system ATP-binding protein